MEPDRWKTVRKCSKCWKFGSGKEEPMYAQYWGTDDQGHKEYRLTCLVCGHNDPITTWNGESGGHGGSHGQDGGAQ